MQEYAKQTAKKQHQHEQRLQLDQQVAEHQHAQELALAAKAAELASVKADVQAYQVQEAAKLATAEQAAQKLKAEQLKQVPMRTGYDSWQGIIVCCILHQLGVCSVTYTECHANTWLQLQKQSVQCMSPHHWCSQQV